MRYMLFDRWGNPLGDLPYAIKAIRTRATDATDTLDITTIGEINKDERIVFKDSMGRWAEYLCQSTQTARAAGMPVTVAYCTGSIAELSRTYIEDKRNRKANAKACLTKALEGTRWAVGTVETGTITGTADLAFYHCTVLDAVQKTADTYGLEVQTEYQPDPTGNQIGRRIIHLVEHRGSTNTTKRFEYGKDLTQIKRDIDSGDVITRLYGWGKGIEQTNDQGEATGGYSRKISFADVNDGKPYVQDDQALANWGIPGPDGTKHHSEASVDFPDCEDPKELLTLTKNALKTRTTPVVSYTADVPSDKPASARKARTSATACRSSTPASPHHCASKAASSRSRKTWPAASPTPRSPSATSGNPTRSASPPNSRPWTSSSPTPAHGTAPPAAPART